jgi:hypothetical protein
MNKPFWVEIGLLGIKSRSAAISWLFSSIAGTVLLAVITYFSFTSILESSHSTAIIFGLLGGAIFSLSSLWYWLCIKWMDNNGGWLK